MNEPTYSKIVEQLDNLGAPPGETIAERIAGLYLALTDAKLRAVAEERGTVDAAWAALNAADLYVAEGTLATGVEGLARRRDDALSRAAVAEQNLENTFRRAAVAEQNLENTFHALRDERETRQSIMAAHRELEAELAQLRAEVARLEAQRDVLAEQIQAAIRASAAPLDGYRRGT